MKHVLHFHVRQFHAWTFRWSVIFMPVIFSAPASMNIAPNGSIQRTHVTQSTQKKTILAFWLLRRFRMLSISLAFTAFPAYLSSVARVICVKKLYACVAFGLGRRRCVMILVATIAALAEGWVCTPRDRVSVSPGIGNFVTFLSFERVARWSSG